MPTEQETNKTEEQIENSPLSYLGQNEMLIIHAFDRMAEAAHDNSIRHGFYDQPEDHHPAVKIALMHSELSELLECHRDDPLAPTNKPIDITCAEEETADAIIRLLDHARKHNMRIGRAVVIKHNYNVTRKHRHGGRQF